MSSTGFDVDSFLSSVVSVGNDPNGSSNEGTEGTVSIPYSEPGYDGKIDYRIRQLSYSSLLTLHTCPRKFQLYKLRSTFRSEQDEKSTITFAFGHAVGQAIQDSLIGLPEEQVAIRMLSSWNAELFAVDEKANKGFFQAYLAMKKFRALLKMGQFKDYELVYFNGKPAVELSFCIIFPDGFRLRGYVDAVLRHKITGEVIVLECKTTGSTRLDDAMYKNSAQAIGYSIVLDVLFPGLSSYKVLYYVYQTGAEEFTPIPFTKDHKQRALWIRELLFDIETIKMYDDAGIYPMRGESCFSFFRQCEYFSTCTLSTEYLTKPMTVEEVDKEEYMINLTLLDILDAQLARTEMAEDVSDQAAVEPGSYKAIDYHPTDGVL